MRSPIRTALAGAVPISILIFMITGLAEAHAPFTERQTIENVQTNPRR
ncbi:MAG TPA: hypothetical protein VL588_06430 [Bdellovibrionota bacterium]|jgi:hypothetical protein|nr:hypothetical protein [Bdellovibrionota bacterium]